MRPNGVDASGARRKRRFDGGIAAWTGPLVTDQPVPEPRAFTARPWPANAVVDANAVGQLATPVSLAVLTCVCHERYRGDTEPIDARAGHIPGARNAPWAANLDPSTGRFLPPEPIREHYTPSVSKVTSRSWLCVVRECPRVTI